MFCYGRNNVIATLLQWCHDSIWVRSSGVGQWWSSMSQIMPQVNSLMHSPSTQVYCCNSNIFPDWNTSIGSYARHQNSCTMPEYNCCWCCQLTLPLHQGAHYKAAGCKGWWLIALDLTHRFQTPKIWPSNSTHSSERRKWKNDHKTSSPQQTYTLILNVNQHSSTWRPTAPSMARSHILSVCQ